MTGHGSKFTRRMHEAVAALLTHSKLEDAAKAAGISVATLVRWQKEPEFQRELSEARRSSRKHMNARVQQLGPAAVNTLGKMMFDPATPPSVRARVSESLINIGTKAFEIEDIEARVAELERITEARKPVR